MKKVKYSFISLLLVGFVCAINAQNYTEPFWHVTEHGKAAPQDGCACGMWAGSIAADCMYISSIDVKDRNNVSVLLGSFTNTEFPGSTASPNYEIVDGYHRVSDASLPVVAGTTIKIKCTSAGKGTGWGNAALYIDWDSNGAFDDHDPYLYNLYDYRSCANVEGAGQSQGAIQPYWEISVPETYSKQTTVRMRIAIDEAVYERLSYRRYEFVRMGEFFPFWTQAASNHIWPALNGTTNNKGGSSQLFYSMMKHALMPSAQRYIGTTLDFDLTIEPDKFLPEMANVQTPVQIIGAGNVSACQQTAKGTAITDAAGFADFLNATSGNYYLANDITVSGVVSQSNFSGTFDGNGYTVTVAAGDATFTGSQQDESMLPYASTAADFVTSIISDLYNKNEANAPLRAYAGGFCGRLQGGTIKNVKVVYAGNVTYNSPTDAAPIFGLVAGLNRGRIENVSVEVAAGATVSLNRQTADNTPSSFAGICGVLYRGVVKHCSTTIDGTLKHLNSGTAGRESILAAVIGRLQCGVVSNVDFNGSGTMQMFNPNYDYNATYIGGVAGMTHTPQGAFCGNIDMVNNTLWGYDNATVGHDVNNILLNYSGSMNMESAAGGTHQYFCRGLLFGEAVDTIVVPTLYATSNLTRIANASADASLTSIPMVSKPQGAVKAFLDVDPAGKYVGDVYIGSANRLDAQAAGNSTWTKITAPAGATAFGFAYEVDPTFCSASLSHTLFYSDGAKTYYREDDTWKESASDPIANPVCGGGGSEAETAVRAATLSCTISGTASHGERYTSGLTFTGSKGASLSVTGLQDGTKKSLYYDKRTSTLKVQRNETITTSWSGGGEWMLGYIYVDWNNDGDFADSGEYMAGHKSSGNLLWAPPLFTIPGGVALGTYTARYTADWSLNNGIDCGANYPCGRTNSTVTDGSGNLTAANGGIMVDFELYVAAADGGGATNTYCAQPTFTNNGTTPPATGYLQNLTANGTALATNWSYDKEKNVTGNTITINQGESLTLDFQFNSQHADKMQWTTALAFVDLNGDGSFTEDERIYAKGGVGWQSSAIGYESLLVDGISNDKPWNSTKTVNFAPTATSSLLRIFTVGEWGINCETKTGSKYISTSACANGDINGDEGANKFHCYDFPIVINPVAGGDGCAYVANFGSVFAGDVVTYDISLGAGFSVTTDVADDEYELVYDDATGKLSVTYTVPAALGAVSVDSIGAITKGVDEFRIAVSATVKTAPTVTFRMSNAGGGALSLDMGKTTFIETRELAPYKGELLTAVPVGPTHITGWHFSTDGGATWTDVGHANPDYTYTGADDAIVEVRFDFDNFEGNFGNSRFTDNSNVPFYISAISTTDGIVNVNATDVFTDATVAGGSARLRYMENQRLQTLYKSLKTLTHNVTVTVQNANKIPADARLMCFIDYNMNNYFDFASSADGLASALSENGELVFVADPNDTDAEQTFTFQISNANIDKFGKSRMRFMVATYVDMFGLGPVNQYGNYQPRFDTDGDGIADSNLPLNDNNGSVYTPNNQCRLENYVNVADVTFEVVAFVRYNDKYVIKNGESVRMKNLYIEAMEDATGFHAGQIVFDKTAPYGSLKVEGNIIIRRRIYPDKWHDLSFPIEMQGVGGKDGVCAVGANGALRKLPATGKHLVYEFDPAGRNQTGGYNGGTHASLDDTFLANKFYEFAADVPDGFTANDAGDGIDGENSYWIQFHSVDTGFVITPSAAKTATLLYTRDEDAAEYWNRNVFTLYNPFLSNINVKEITSSVGWENITWWNAAQNRYTGVSAAETRDMPPHFGYWIQFTEGIGSVAPISIVLGDASRNDYPYASDNDRVVNFALRIAAQAPTFDTPDSYTLGIDAAENASNETAVSSTIVTLTDEGSIDNFRAGYDMPASFAAADAEVPEIWTKAGESNMMFNDVRRADEVVVPVGIRIKEAGEYAVRLTHTNDTTSLVQLRDKETGAIVDLQSDGEESSYLFLADEGDANRFELVISKAPQMVTDLEFVETLQGEGEAQVYVIGDNLCLKNIAMGYSVSVCDVLGREYLRTLVTEADMKVLLPAMRGVYMVNILDKQNISVQSVKVTK